MSPTIFCWPHGLNWAYTAVSEAELFSKIQFWTTALILPVLNGCTRIAPPLLPTSWFVAEVVQLLLIGPFAFPSEIVKPSIIVPSQNFHKNSQCSA